MSGADQSRADEIRKEIAADGVMTLTIARPEKKNALTGAMYRSLEAALGEAQDSPDRVGAVVIAGAGGIFTAGNDLKDFLAENTPEEGGAGPAAALLRRLIAIDVPLLAAVEGPAIGVGVTLLLHCEAVLAGPEASFRTPFVDLGACPEGGASLLMPARLGRAASLRLLLLGEALNAAEALECGLVDRISGDPLAEATALARRLAAKPRAALRESKRLLRAAREPALSETVEREIAAFAALLSSPEAQAAIKQFFSKP